MEKFFQIKKRKSSIKTELIGGLLNFVAMVYILFVNSSIMAEAGMPYQGVFIATAIASGLSTILMGLWTNTPAALAPGMGINAFFTYGVALGMGFGWEKALSIVFVSGVLFLIATVTKLRLWIVRSIPHSLKDAMVMSIGAFIIFLGLNLGKIIVGNQATLVSIGKISDPGVLLAIIGIVVALIMIVKNIKGAILISMLVTIVLGLGINALGIKSAVQGAVPSLPNFAALKFDFGAFQQIYGVALKNVGWVFKTPAAWFPVIIFLMVDLFDTIGSIAPFTRVYKTENERAQVEKKMLEVDAVATTFSSILGVSTVTTFVESLIGFKAGARTGLAAVFTGILFLLSLLLWPVTSLFSTAVSAVPLVVVGILMFLSVKNIEWDDMPLAVSTVLMMIIMVLSFAIHWGIIAAFVTYPILKVAQKKAKDVTPGLWFLFIISILFAVISVK